MTTNTHFCLKSWIYGNKCTNMLLFHSYLLQGLLKTMNNDIVKLPYEQVLHCRYILPLIPQMKMLSISTKANYINLYIIPLVWWDGLDGWTGGRSRKVSFKFLHTFWVYRLCITLLIYEIKIVTNILMGFKISCQVGGRGQKFQNYSR